MVRAATSKSLDLPLVHFDGPWTAREREQLGAAAEAFDGGQPGKSLPVEAGARWVAVKTTAPWGTLYATHRLDAPTEVTTARSLPALIDMLHGRAT